ncbi:DNA methyltransferase [Ignavibacteriales bacterium]
MNLKKYLSEITETYKRGDAREESYYSTLKDLVSAFSDQKLNRPVDVTVLPKKTEAGNPDFRIWDGANSITGYIEAKIPGTNLDDIEDTDQLKRYLKTFPNVILTNFLEFRLYRDGTQINSVTIGRWNNIKTLRVAPPVEKVADFEKLLEKFISYSQPAITSAEKLAKVLAQRTRFLRDEIIKIELPVNDDVKGFYEAFTKYLIANLVEDEFADLYSQTITYGLFAARLRSGGNFNRQLAFQFIPKTIGILKEIFTFVSVGNLPKQMEAIIDDIAAVLSATDVKAILEEYYKAGKGSDPIIHFYETFLQEYDPSTREMRGVYYTPEPVVDFMVRSVNTIIKEKFGIAAGLAGENVTLLDPAGGTLSFFTMAMKVAVDEYVKLYGEGMKKQFIKKQLLKNFYAFELMMDPYAIGHMKTSFMLEELGYQLEDDDRVQYFLTNTLEMEDLDTIKIPGLSSLSKESHLAGEVKKNTKIQIVIGNPPYSGHSSNNSPWIREKVSDYYFVDGVSINEKNSKWLQDDYVKFIRFAQHKIDHAGEGIVCMITNHGYIDNPTFRGMRKSLINSFDEIYVLDLHGNALKKEKAPDGGKDENVFDIRQGVAILIMIKSSQPEKNNRISQIDLFGTRLDKYGFLTKEEFNSVDWKTITPQPGFFLLRGQDDDLFETYKDFIDIRDFFHNFNVGIVTARDSLTIQDTKEKMFQTVKKFVSFDPEVARDAFGLGRDSNDWKVLLAQKDLLEFGIAREFPTPILYRPFDVKFTYFTGKAGGFICRPRKDTMKHLLHDNLGILTCRQNKVGNFAHVFITNNIVESCAVSNKTSEINYVFPLHLMPDEEHVFQERLSNLKEEIIKLFTDHFILTNTEKLDPESIFFYIYGILHSSDYRIKYAEFLKIDFPRIPLIKDLQCFRFLAEKGKELAELHTLKSESLNSPSSRYFGDGNNKVEFVRYEEDKVWINEVNHFSSVQESTFDFMVGSYRVCEKWLKDRKGKELTLDEVQTYCKIVTALEKTIEIQRQIDEVIEV